MPESKHAHTSHNHPDYQGAVVFHARGPAGPITYAISEAEAGATGFRETTNPYTDERIVQFGLCRDEHGAWVYPPFKKPNETVDEMLARNAEARRRLQRCATTPGHDHA